MNERGNITLAMVVVLLVVGTAIVITSTLLTIQGVVTRSAESTKVVYEKDSAVEAAKYVLVNELSGLEFTTFDEETELLTPEDLNRFEEVITTTLQDMENETILSIGAVNPIKIDTICTHLYNEGEESEYLGMYCEYEPVDLDIEFTYTGKEDTGVAVKGLMKVEGIHLYEDEGVIRVDDTDVKVTFN